MRDVLDAEVLERLRAGDEDVGAARLVYVAGFL